MTPDIASVSETPAGVCAAGNTARWLNRCHFGDVRAVLRQMIADGVKVNCIVTSHPYWGLRSYLPDDHPAKHLELGSEPTFEAHLDNMFEVYGLARQVLADDGVLWFNCGDSYVGDRRGPDDGSTLEGSRHNQAQPRLAQRQMTESRRRDDHAIPRNDFAVDGLKPKDLIGQGWAIAFALRDGSCRCAGCELSMRKAKWPVWNGHTVCLDCERAGRPSKVIPTGDGYYLRQDVIWHKPNPMPESAKDRCTKAHEYVFLLAKSRRYYYNFAAMQEPVRGTANARSAAASMFPADSEREGEARRRTIKSPDGWDTGPGGHGTVHRAGRERGATKAYAGNGVSFGHGYDERAPERGRVSTPKAEQGQRGTKNNASMDAALVDTRNRRSVWTIPTQGYAGAHFATFPEALVEPCVRGGCPPKGTVLDIFFGSGTTGQVAQRLGFNWIGIDLNDANAPLQAERLRQPSLDLEAA